MKDIISVEWLSKHLEDRDLILLDASLSSTADGKLSDLHGKTIQGSRYFDLDGVFSDKSSPLPHMLPSEKQFEEESQKLGIDKQSKLIVFDNMGIYSSPRIWWMYKTMGHDQIAVLDGGLPEWVRQGHPVVLRKNETYERGDFKAKFRREYLITYADINKNVTGNAFQIVDARSRDRFDGTGKEPRKHLLSGHIPHSVNIPYEAVLNNGKFKTIPELQKIFSDTCNKDKDLVFSCGSGLTACIIMLASEISFKRSRLIYDGSWTEWAELKNLTIDNV